MLENLEMRCPRLGHEVNFGYCLRESGDLPCQRVILCWQVVFPVEHYLRSRLTPDQWERRFHQAPKGKIATIIELIEAARKDQPDSP